MSWNPVEYLKARHTRVLLDLRNACQRCHGFYSVGETYERKEITLEQVLTELNTRKHIPCKNEAKLLRRIMSQNKITEEQVRATPKFATMLAQDQYRRVVDAEMFNRYKTHAPDFWVTKKMLVLPN